MCNEAKRRDFSVGVAGGKSPSALDNAIEEETLKRVAKLNARIGLTSYPCEMREA